MPNLSVEDLRIQIQSWLTSNHKRIESFWLYASWQLWARYELYMHLTPLETGLYLINHGTSLDDLLLNKDTEVNRIGIELEADIVMEPYNSEEKAVALFLRCERVTENDTSFPAFKESFECDARRLKKVSTSNQFTSDFDGTKILLVGFSAEPMGDEVPFGEDSEDKLEVKHFFEGDVHAWFVEFDRSVVASEDKKS